jgi:hypothetical protein
MTALNWNPEGTLLAIGSYDTVLRILTSQGASYFTHYQHRVRMLLEISFRFTDVDSLGTNLLCAVLSQREIPSIC